MPPFCERSTADWYSRIAPVGPAARVSSSIRVFIAPGATAFTSYGAFWLSFWAFVEFFEKDVPKADAGHAVGLYLIAWGIFTAYMFVASLRTTAAVAVVFFLLALTFIVLGIGNAGGHTNIVHLGGWLGLATAAAAWYASFAAVTNSTFGRAVLPVKHLG